LQGDRGMRPLFEVLYPERLTAAVGDRKIPFTDRSGLDVAEMVIL